jgi:plasmid stabilization system protein ParE
MDDVKIIWSERALAEYEDLVDYLWEEWGEQITMRVLNSLDAAITKIKNHPEHYPVVIKIKLIRRHVFSPQTSIFYRVKNEDIEIVSLFDNRQNPDKLNKL